MRILNDWLTYWNEYLRIIDETFIRHTSFQHAQKIPTNTTNCNRGKRSQAHIYELHNNGRLTHSNWNEFYSGPIRKYTQVDVGGCSMQYICFIINLIGERFITMYAHIE